MRKRGFTLVELLAVLVLIAAVSLIIFPSIINYISSSKDDISDTSKNLIYESTKLYVDSNKGLFPETAGNTYCVTVGELMDNDYLETTFKDAVSGKTIDRDKKIKVSFEYDNDLKINKFKYDLDDSCEPNHYLCKRKEEVTNGNKAEGNFNYGDEYSCELGDGEEKTFYVLENNTDTVSLIMNMNIDSEGKGTTSGNTVAWCKSGYDNSCAADGAIDYLKTSTKNWTKLNQSQISLPSANQIAKANGASEWTTGAYGDALLIWFYDNLNDDADNPPIGYWTSTPESDSNYYDMALYVGNITAYGTTNISVLFGIRPVITISKDQLN